MTAEQALRFVAYEASWCRNRDASEAVCLLLPPVLRALDLSPMDSFEAERFRRELKADDSAPGVAIPGETLGTNRVCDCQNVSAHPIWCKRIDDCCCVIACRRVIHDDDAIIATQ